MLDTDRYLVPYEHINEAHNLTEDVSLKANTFMSDYSTKYSANNYQEEMSDLLLFTIIFHQTIA